ncbi:MAG: hypothetical protein R3C59_01930 [Planctomycetaceae bacterium]
MSPSITNELTIPAPKPRTPPGESELQQFARLLDQFFARLGI